MQEERERPYKTMESRLAAYRQECEARLQDELRRQVTFIVCMHAHNTIPCVHVLNVRFTAHAAHKQVHMHLRMCSVCA